MTVSEEGCSDDDFFQTARPVTWAPRDLGGSCRFMACPLELQPCSSHHGKPCRPSPDTLCYSQHALFSHPSKPLA